MGKNPKPDDWQRTSVRGLYKRPIIEGGKVIGHVYHVKKRARGQLLCESTGTADFREAQQYLARRLEELRAATVYGTRPKRTFEQAAARYLDENAHKRSISDDVTRLDILMPYLAHVPLDRVHRDCAELQRYVMERRAQGRADGTINHGLKLVRQILNLAARVWHDENGMTWLATAPKIRLLPDKNKREPYPLNWEEQERLFRELAAHLERMALFAVNTGLRDQEICGLRWDWEVRVPELNTSVFIIPGQRVKNGEDRLVVLNSVARSVIDEARGQHSIYVFTYRGHRVGRALNSGWKAARDRAGLPQVRFHDLKHTFGRRLRAAGVGFEDRQDLLGHRSERITTHYSAPDLERLIEAAERVATVGRERPALVILRRAAG